MQKGECILDDCHRQRKYKTLCNVHYHRKRRGSIRGRRMYYEMHGYHPLYVTWQNMRRRCSDPKATSYDRYGGRGIKVCEKWEYSFSAFLQDVGEKPSPEHTLDRIDNNGDYEPGNVRWATKREQSLNQALRSDNQTGHKGVCLDSRSRKWRAYVGGGKSRIELGRYEDKSMAIEAVKNHYL